MKKLIAPVLAIASLWSGQTLAQSVTAESETDTELSKLQPPKNLGDPPGSRALQWSVGSSPEITTNWIASGGKWTVPVGGGFGKAFQLGGQPMKLELDAYYNAIRPKAGNETWLLQAKLTFVFPD
jgi:hypothetical protein